jgi:hypothetical protein
MGRAGTADAVGNLFGALALIAKAQVNFESSLAIAAVGDNVEAFLVGDAFIATDLIGQRLARAGDSAALIDHAATTTISRLYEHYAFRFERDAKVLVVERAELDIATD